MPDQRTTLAALIPSLAPGRYLICIGGRTNGHYVVLRTDNRRRSTIADSHHRVPVPAKDFAGRAQDGAAASGTATAFRDKARPEPPVLPCQRHRNKQKATQAAEGMSKQQQAPHVILNVEPDASQEEVRTAFRQLAKTYHPDVSSDPDATVRFQEINDAYRAMIGRRPAPTPNSK